MFNDQRITSPSSTATLYQTQAQPQKLPVSSYEDLQSINKPNLAYLDLDSTKVNSKLGGHLGNLKAQLDNNPKLIETLNQSELGRDLLAVLDKASQGGQLSEDDVVKLQSFIVASGIDISHAGDADGIDGMFGPRTFAGLNQALEAFTNNPSQAAELLQGNQASVQDYSSEARSFLSYGKDPNAVNFDMAQSRAARGLDATPRLRRLNQNEATIPTNTSYTPPTIPGDTSNLQGNALANVIGDAAESYNTDGKRRQTTGNCALAVRMIMERAGIKITPGHAYQHISHLRNDSRFQEVPAPDDMRTLPRGAIVVWPKGSSKYGHISVALGDGREASDHITRQMQQHYGGGKPVIFMPKGT